MNPPSDSPEPMDGSPVSGSGLQSHVSTLRHKLCTPLNGIIGFSELLLEDINGSPTKPPTLTRDLKVIRDAGWELQARIDRVLGKDLSCEGAEMKRLTRDLRQTLQTPLRKVMGVSATLLENDYNGIPAGMKSDLASIRIASRRFLKICNGMVD